MKKILIITVPSWNSKVGANSWATLLTGHSPENLASIYIRDEIPDSEICSRYFNISENKIIKSIFDRSVKTGTEIVSHPADEEDDENLKIHNQRYGKMKVHRRYSMLLARELIWKFGKWHTPELDEFLDDFKPDIILHSMDGYIHLNRIIEYAIKRTGAKAIGYIWDDNFTYKQSKKVGYKLYRFFQRGSLKRLAKKTNQFFAISDMTKDEADQYFNIDCKLLTKPINSKPVVEYGEFDECIKLLYTGNLYIGRERSLLKVVKAVKKFPKGRFFVDVYTNSQLPESILSEFDSDVCCIHDPVSQSEALQKQREADVLLFLEDIDGPDANIARLSFSTKTTDYLSSGRCIFAVGNKDTAPLRYLDKNNAALVAGSETEIYDTLCRVNKNPKILIEAAQNAAKVAMENHNKEKILKIFNDVVDSL